MASFTSPPLEPAVTADFVAPPGCAPHLRQAYEKAVNAHPITWRLEPTLGEVFKDLAEAERRLKYYSLATGFDIVRGSGGTRSSPGAVFLCFYHGQKTRNFRGLEDSVMRDQDGTIVSRRQRESTSVRQRGCSWSVRVSWKSISKRGSKNKAFILIIKSLTHEDHDLTENPLTVFPRYLVETQEYREVLETARYYRLAIIPYSASRRVLESTEFGISLTHKQYYNSVRRIIPNKDDSLSIQGLLIALFDHGFIYIPQVLDERDSTKPDRVVSRKLVSI